MKKVLLFSFISSLSIVLPALATSAQVRQFHGEGEVLTVDPVYSRITIQHKAIKDFSGDRDSEFFVKSADLLKGIQTGDLVEFDITDDKGDVKIDKIQKTGIAPPKSDDVPLGQAVHDVLEGTGNVVKGVTEPLPPAHEVAKGATSITDATGDALKEGDPELKSKF